MDTVDPIQTEPQVPQGPKQEKTALVVTVVISTVVLLIIGIIIVYILSNSNINNQNKTYEQLENTSYVTNKSSEPLTFQYTGEYVNGTLPLEWSLVEYNDISGMKYAVEDPQYTYSGLTGFEIIDENGDAIFSFKGVDGIGGSDGCTELAQFADTQASYIQSIQERTTEAGLGNTNVTDYTSTEYTEITFAGKEFRRIGNNLFVNVSTDSNYFNPGCGITRNIVSTSTYSFSINNSNTTGQTVPYDFRINPSETNEEKLALLDAALNSMN